ncbi:MAG: hypothetical protein DLM72_15420 [Candidatus Nitrosopolaris wilkensis]|nr:MAG: hypothetical protein DLM72_15420 [Candidatus Nitrosopolaris wilkensis]
MSQSEAPPNNISPSAIMQMATGFWVSKTLMTAVGLGVFTKISAYQKNNNGKSMTLREFQNIIRIEENRQQKHLRQHLYLLGY